MTKKKHKAGPVGLRPHPEAERIARGLERCLPLAIAWAGALFRATSQDYANRRDVVTGEGSRAAGARYTPRGAFPAVYGSLDLETALAEALGNHRRLGLPDTEALPLTFVALRVTAQRVLDLTAGAVRRTLGISQKRLRAPWRGAQKRRREALTQAVGRLARAGGWQGILYSSAERARGRNLVLFPDLLGPGHLKIVHAERLPARRRRPTRA
jgi:RES domain-containing protein